MSSSFQSLRDLKKKTNKKKNSTILLIKDGYLPLSVNSHFYKKNNSINKHSKLYRCVLTGRTKFVLNKYKITRMAFKSLSNNGLIPGSKKSSH